MSSETLPLKQTAHPTVEELRGIPIFSDLSQEGLEWMASQMTVVDLNPLLTAVTEYNPASMEGTDHSPRSFVVTVVTWFVPTSFTCTWADGTAAPVGSVTTPLIKLVLPP